MIFNFFKHIFCSGGGSVASLGGVCDLPLARSHHLQLLRQLLHLYLQGGISLIYFHLYFTCLKTFNIYLSTDKRGFKKSFLSNFLQMPALPKKKIGACFALFKRLKRAAGNKYNAEIQHNRQYLHIFICKIQI